MLQRDLLPVMPAQGSVGASGDLAPLAHMAAAMIGVGEVWLAGARMPAAEGLAKAGLAPIVLEAKEGLALLNGTQFSCAYALCGLFEIERVFHAALATGALVDRRGARLRHAVRSAHPRAAPPSRPDRRRRRVARADGGSAIRASHLTDDSRVQDPYCLRCQPQVMGACLDLMRQAARTLEDEANGVTDNPLIFAEDDEALSGGNFHAEPVAFAADMLALAVCEIGSLAERRIAMLVDPALVGPAGVPDADARPQLRLHDGAGDGGGAGVGEQAARLSRRASIRSRPRPTRKTTSRWPRMARAGCCRMARNAANIVAIEALAAAQALRFPRAAASSAPLEALRARIRAAVPHLDEDRYFHADLAAAQLVSAGALAEGLDLPRVDA